MIQTENPPGEHLAGQTFNVLLAGNNRENAPKAAHVQEAITSLKREFVAEALRIAAIKASHAADDVEIADDICAERGIRLAIEHLKAAAQSFREIEQLTAGGAQ